MPRPHRLIRLFYVALSLTPAAAAAALAPGTAAAAVVTQEFASGSVPVTYSNGTISGTASIAALLDNSPHLFARIPGTNWINWDPSGAPPPVNASIPSACGSLAGVMSYFFRFTLPERFANPKISGVVNADNAARVLLNGTEIGSQRLECILDNFQGPPDVLPTRPVDASLFHAGENVLEFVNIDWGVIAGIDFLVRVEYEELRDADLAIQKTGPALVQDGADATYTLRVTNAGPADASNVVVTDVLPAGTAFVSGSPECSGSSATVTCTIAHLVTNASHIFAITVAVDTAAFLITNTASVAGAEEDPDTANNTSSVTSAVNHAPDCSTATAIGPPLWPPNHELRPFAIAGATDPDGDSVAIAVTGVSQDEPVTGLGDGDTAPDAAFGPTASEVSLRAERSANGDGRVYRMAFVGTDGRGGSCSGTAMVGVPHDQDGQSAVDSGTTFNSLAP